MSVLISRKVAARDLRRGALDGAYRWSLARVGRCEQCARDPRASSPIRADLFVGRRVDEQRDLHGRVARASCCSTGALCVSHAVAAELSAREVRP